MESRTTHTWAVGLFGAAVAFAVVALAAHGWRAWVALGLAALCIFLAAVFGLIAYRDRPRLFIGHPLSTLTVFTRPLPESSFSTNVATSGFVGPTGPTGATARAPSNAVLHETHPVVYLHVWNEPKRNRSSRKAEGVHLSLVFRDGERELCELVGRWSDLDQRDAPETYSIPRDRDIPPNRNRYRIDVAAFLDNGIYAMNDQARMGGFTAFPLGSGPVTVIVTAMGTGGVRAESVWQLVRTPQALTLTPVTVPRTRRWWRRKSR